MKKIILCFDGTGNEPKDGLSNDKKDENISNVLKLFIRAGGNLDTDNDGITRFTDQRAFYYSGVGTRGSFFTRAARAIFAGNGPNRIMKEALEDLERIYQKNDRLYIFGFSRGAAIARKFASKLAKNGLQTSEGELDANPVVEFLGVWDTVAAFGLVDLDADTRPNSDVLFEDNSIAPIIREAVHFVSIDETRLVFQPTLMNDEERVTEIWFTGVHSDVGGGYDLSGLSDLALLEMIKYAELNPQSQQGLTFISEDNLDKSHFTYQNDNKTIQSLPLKAISAVINIREKIHSHDSAFDNVARTLRHAYRHLCVVKNNVPTSSPPKIHQSVLLRMKLDDQYRPNNLPKINDLLRADVIKSITNID